MPWTIQYMLVSLGTKSLAPPSETSHSLTSVTTLTPSPQSTPIMTGISSTAPFTTNQKFCIESCTTMGKEKKIYIVGPMPAQQFLDDFFPIDSFPGLDSVPWWAWIFWAQLLSSHCQCQKIKWAYMRFISPILWISPAIFTIVIKIKAIQTFTPGFRIINSSNSVDHTPILIFHSGSNLMFQSITPTQTLMW